MSKCEPFVRYTFSTIMSIYNDFEDRMNIIQDNKSSVSMVEGP